MSGAVPSASQALVRSDLRSDPRPGLRPDPALALGAGLLTLQTTARLARLLRGEPGEDMRLRIGQDIE